MADQVTERRKRLIRSLLEEHDKDTLEKRVHRWLRAGSYYSEDTEVLVDLFYNDAFDMFVDGYFIGTILLCESIVEAILRDKTGAKTDTGLEKLTKSAIERRTRSRVGTMTYGKANMSW